jgi:hypothetical protein
MAWVLIQKAQEATWADYERVAQAIGVDENPPEGLILHAAGEEDGKWRMVTVWESQAAHDRFRDERILPAVRATMGDAAIDAGPPPEESFEVKHIVKP